MMPGHWVSSVLAPRQDNQPTEVSGERGTQDRQFGVRRADWDILAAGNDW